MRAAILREVGQLSIEEKSVPPVRPGSVLVRVRACAVCGSDLRIMNHGNDRVAFPRIIGHEIAGEVVAVGAKVEKYSVGDRISTGADVPCGACSHCLSGRPNCCEINLAIGYQFDGGYAEYILLDPLVVEHGPLQKFGADLAFEDAALAEPLACCINGWERTHLGPASTAAIFGAGPIGIMLARLAPMFGVSRVIFIEPDPMRRESLKAFGYKEILDPLQCNPAVEIMNLTFGLGVDRVFTACPAVETHELAVEIIAKRGVINFFGGLPKTSRSISISSNAIHYREAVITGSHGSTPEQHQKALQLIESGKIKVGDLISHRFQLNDIHLAFSVASSRQGLKVIVEPS